MVIPLREVEAGRETIKSARDHTCDQWTCFPVNLSEAAITTQKQSITNAYQMQISNSILSFLLSPEKIKTVNNNEIKSISFKAYYHHYIHKDFQ